MKREVKGMKQQIKCHPAAWEIPLKDKEFFSLKGRSDRKLPISRAPGCCSGSTGLHAATQIAVRGASLYRSIPVVGPQGTISNSPLVPPPFLSQNSSPYKPPVISPAIGRYKGAYTDTPGDRVAYDWLVSHPDTGAVVERRERKAMSVWVRDSDAEK